MPLCEIITIHPKRTARAVAFQWTALKLLNVQILYFLNNLNVVDCSCGTIKRFILSRLHLLSEEEKGAAFSVFKDGQLVVDLWGGYADIEAWQPWKKCTVANIYSLYNVAVSLSLGLLYERLVGILWFLPIK